MPKLSRPVVYTFVAAVAAYAAVLLTQPDPPARRRTVHLVTTRPTNAADADGLTDADLTARFARYVPGKRDPFVPKVVPPKSGGVHDAAPGGPRDTWALTGLYTVNGARNALVENRSTQDSVALKPGDHWRGLRVLAIDGAGVTLENALGQKTRLTFAPPPAEDHPARRGGRGDYRLPALRVVGPLRPMPIVGPLPPLSPAGVPMQMH